MNPFIVLAAHNTVIALVLALAVFGVRGVRRNPPLTHVLWLLVLLKFITPPLVHFDLPAVSPGEATQSSRAILADASPADGQRPDCRPRPVDPSTDPGMAQPSVTSFTERDLSAIIVLVWNGVQPVLLGLWLGGVALCSLVTARRIVRFERALRDTLPASDRLHRRALEIGGKLGIRRSFDVRYAECVEVPLLWCAGRRPTIVLPLRLLGQLDDERTALILAHELAHLRRRDHWVRAVELIVATLYWWNPLVWLIQRQLHQVEDLCCDAWVRWAFPDSTKRYAEVLLHTAESTRSSRLGAQLLPASPFLRSLSLKARIEMILESRFAPTISPRSLFVATLFSLVVLPSFVPLNTTEAGTGTKAEAAAAPPAQPNQPITSEFPYALKFEQGATRFANGDEIKILEVRGTNDTFTPGNIYWVKGAYTLASHDRAILLASITATDPFTVMSMRSDPNVRSDHVPPGKSTDVNPGRATGVEFKVQRATAHRGTGTFTLFLPMSYKGAPHVSFYPFEGGEGFGGNYFGTGESVLKKWWGTKDSE